MRDAVFQAIEDAAADAPTWFLTGDLGYRQVDRLRDLLGARFLNVGVAEQNLVSVATGLALSGDRVFVYSIGPFVTMRAADQIRMGPVLHALNVCVICGGSGLHYAQLGYSHYALQDIGLMRSLGMTVYTPTSSTELASVCLAIRREPGPKYLRLERGVINTPARSLLDAPQHVGLDVLLVGYGDVISAACVAAERLNQSGVQARVLSVPIFDAALPDRLAPALAGVTGVVCVEEHSRVGGLGSAVAEALGRRPGPALAILGTDAGCLEACGSRPHLQRALGIDSEAIVCAAQQLISSAGVGEGPTRRAVQRP